MLPSMPALVSSGSSRARLLIGWQAGLLAGTGGLPIVNRFREGQAGNLTGNL